eukprot:jgi/Chlat1/4730/Chrsp30S00369
MQPPLVGDQLAALKQALHASGADDPGLVLLYDEAGLFDHHPEGVSVDDLKDRLRDAVTRQGQHVPSLVVAANGMTPAGGGGGGGGGGPNKQVFSGSLRAWAASVTALKLERWAQHMPGKRDVGIAYLAMPSDQEEGDVDFVELPFVFNV